MLNEPFEMYKNNTLPSVSSIGKPEQTFLNCIKQIFANKQCSLPKMLLTST
jgi:hypothetical protein